MSRKNVEGVTVKDEVFYTTFKQLDFRAHICGELKFSNGAMEPVVEMADFEVARTSDGLEYCLKKGEAITPDEFKSSIYRLAGALSDKHGKAYGARVIVTEKDMLYRIVDAAYVPSPFTFQEWDTDMMRETGAGFVFVTAATWTPIHACGVVEMYMLPRDVRDKMEDATFARDGRRYERGHMTNDTA